MCGFAGFVDSRCPREEQLTGIGTRMRDTLVHRGPDDGGTWVDPSAGVALGSRRLAILDLSPAGHQPMVSASGRWVIAYNGEIYNHGELTRRLRAGGWEPSGHSDTEVLLAAIEAWGLEPTVRATNGMFAFAAWDTHERRLHLVRDRLGEKPLYWGWQGQVLLFGSELKALRAHPDFAAEVDRDALAVYLRRNCVPAPQSIYAGIHKLPPGSIVSLGAAEWASRSAEPVAYWSARSVVEGGSASRGLDGTSPGDVVDELERLLGDAVALRMEADVPLGAFLSGGVDSSTVVALMQARSSRPIRTFTIGFGDAGYDESADAGAVARHLGTDHTAVVLSPADAMAVLPELPGMYDEPFADSSQIPTYLVSRVARQAVTVALSGDGGDELWAGYNRHVWGGRIWDTARRLPLPARRAAATALTRMAPARWDALFQQLGPALPARLRVRTPGAKVHKLASVLPAESPAGLYQTLVSHWPRPEQLVVGAAGHDPLVAQALPVGLDGLADQMMFLDLVTYLPDDILVKLDRAAMAVSLESRVPMLDHRVVEYAWRVPAALKLHDGSGKWPLRQVLHRYVPPALVDRPKMGFGLPLGDWLRADLRPWAEELLDAESLRRQGYLRPEPIRAAWDAHLSGRVDLAHQLWDVLMFQAWLEGELSHR